MEVTVRLVVQTAVQNAVYVKGLCRHLSQWANFRGSISRMFKVPGGEFTELFLKPLFRFRVNQAELTQKYRRSCREVPILRDLRQTRADVETPKGPLRAASSSSVCSKSGCCGRRLLYFWPFRSRCKVVVKFPSVATQIPAVGRRTLHVSRRRRPEHSNASQ